MKACIANIISTSNMLDGLWVACGWLPLFKRAVHTVPSSRAVVVVVALGLPSFSFRVPLIFSFLFGLLSVLVLDGSLMSSFLCDVVVVVVG